MSKFFTEYKLKGTVHYEIVDSVALLTVDNPPVNPLSEGVRNGLYEGIAKAEADAYKTKLSPELQVKSDQMVKQLEADPNS